MHTTFDMPRLMAAAEEKEGLSDWGPLPFQEPLAALLDSYAAAELNDIGVYILRSGIVHSLRMRLRAQEWIRRNPEITDERIDAPIVVVGMMRSGTTLLQRLLAADPRFHCAYGWEVVEVAPKLDHVIRRPRTRGSRSAKRARRRPVNSPPDLFAIHPMYALEAEEEIVFLADAFLSHVPESGAHVPAYRAWLDDQDFTPAYDHLHRMLQFLQWQKRHRGQVASAGCSRRRHTSAISTTCARSSPTCTWCTCTATRARPSRRARASTRPCTRCTPTTVDLHRVGAEWIERMGWTNDRAMATRRLVGGRGAAGHRRRVR